MAVTVARVLAALVCACALVMAQSAAAFAAPSLSVPTLARNADGRLEVFAIGGDGNLWHSWQLSPNSGWGGWNSLGGGGLAPVPPQVGTITGGRLEVFARKQDGSVVHVWQLTGGGWSGWANLGGSVTGRLSVAKNTDGRLEVFGRRGGHVWHVWQQCVGCSWSSWADLGGTPDPFVGDPVVASNGDGRLEVFSFGTDRALWHSWQKSTGGWSAWGSMGKPGGLNMQGAPSVARNADGRLEVFANFSEIWHIWQQPGGGWSGWSNLGQPFGDGFDGSGTAAAAMPDGSLAVFGRSSSFSDVRWFRQLCPGCGWTAQPAPLDPSAPNQFTTVWGPLSGRVSVAANKDGRLEVVSAHDGGDIWHIWQTAPNSATWSGYGPIPG